jgi:opacity protein-like surface antigen
MKTLRCCALLALFGFFTAVPSRANDLTLYGGTQNPGSLTLRSASGAVLAVRPKTFGTFGLRFAHGRVIGSETTFAYSPNFLSSDHSAIILNSNLMVQAPLPIVRPYATAGLGIVYVRGSGLQSVTGAKFALNYGGGLKIKLAGPLGVQLDGRGYSLFGMDAQTLRVLEASVGLVFSF